jgi:excisionase family DNA binding protein
VIDRLLSVEELAEICGVPVRTVYSWRLKGQGPRGIRVGRFVRYRPADVERWLEEQADPQSGR